MVHNVPSDQLSEFRDLVNDQLSRSWDMSPAPGEPSSYLLTMRPTRVAEIREQTMQQSIETIERRINALGLTEPTIQRRGGHNPRTVAGRGRSHAGQSSHSGGRTA